MGSCDRITRPIKTAAHRAPLNSALEEHWALIIFSVSHNGYKSFFHD
jgi:hypothetical protein